MGRLRMLRQQLDVLLGRYEGVRVASERDHQECLAVLDEVRRLELRRVHGDNVLESTAFQDVEVDDLLIAVRDTSENRIVGLVRSTPARQIAEIPSSRAEYRLDLLPDDLLDRTQVLTRFAILKSHRSSPASFVIVREMYRYSLEHDRLLSLLSCEPGLYAGYLRIGFRPLGAVHPSSSGGFRLPMAHVHHDHEHMKRVRSPLLRELPSDKTLPTAALDWWRALEATEGHIDAGVAFYDEAADAEDGVEVHAWLTEGLSEKGKDELLQNAMEVDCADGDVVIAAGDGGRFMGFVLDGVVEVKSDDRVLRVLGEGELFGEIALVLDRPRTVDIIAAGDDTRVLVLSQKALERLTDGADQARVWRNIAKVLAKRLPYTT